MRRRLVLATAACWVAVRAPAQEPGQAHRRISAREVRKSLRKRFPIDFGLPGLLVVQVNAGRLVLLPERQRVALTLVARIAEVASGQVSTGDIDLGFAVRYEASDQTLRAGDIQVVGLQSPSLPRDTAQLLQSLLDGAARRAVEDVVLHRFSAQELQLPDLLGLQPERITIENDGVEIWFAPKPLR